MKNNIRIYDQNHSIKAELAGETEESGVILAWEGCYEEGDQILFQVAAPNEFYVIQADDSMGEAYVYMTQSELTYTIPFGEKKTSYNPKAFDGERHYLTLRKAFPWELGYRNLAVNPLDQHGEHGCYPHALANVETRGEAVFAARNAIDGVCANRSHGQWPYESWGINRQDDAELTLEFGRAVDFDQIVLYTRADFPHDNWWEQVTFTFSDGTSETAALKKQYEPHVLPITRKGITWLKLGKLIKADDPSPFPALTQIQVYGTEAK
ncbi:MAG: carbohydrate-binding protein [Lachnospiraceae bacterium]|nr:carbohydrate-binding protein [Lachnospiraceae bacterium]